MDHATTVNIIRTNPYEGFVKFFPGLSDLQEEAQKIASACRSNMINVKVVMGQDIHTPISIKWTGDHLGAIAQGLSGGRIQLQQRVKGTRELQDNRAEEETSTTRPKDWSEVFVAYVYCGEVPSEQILRQARVNEDCVLSTADLLFPGQYVAVTSELKVVVGDTLGAVVGYIQGNGATKAIERTTS